MRELELAQRRLQKQEVACAETREALEKLHPDAMFARGHLTAKLARQEAARDTTEKVVEELEAAE